MIDIKQFSELQKASKNSFNEQKKLVKKVMAGQEVLCPQCKKPISLIIPEDCSVDNNAKSGVRCKKGCTELQLDFV